MIQLPRHKIGYLLFILSVGITSSSNACTCIGKDRQTTASEFSFADLVVEGKIIRVADFIYYDTSSCVLTGIPFDPQKSGYMIRRYKLYTLVVENRFKSAKVSADTISIITGYGDGDCGYQFEEGKKYIVYGKAWIEKVINLKPRKKKNKYRIREVTVANRFYTDICRLTQESNPRELDKIRAL